MENQTSLAAADEAHYVPDYFSDVSTSGHINKQFETTLSSEQSAFTLLRQQAHVWHVA